MNRFSVCLFLACAGLSSAALSQEEESLTITTWGGAYEASQQQAYFQPFENETGIKIRLKAYNGGIQPLRQQTPNGGGEWDVLDLTAPDALAACEEGLLEPFDPTSLPPAPNGTPAEEDFLNDAFLDCGVAHLVYSTVLAFDDKAFPGEKPQTVADFFDLERFPGKRALRRQPIAMLEWALLSYGIPISQVYDLLSTERGMTLAFRRLDQIRDHIVWWESGAEPVELLRSGQVVMASGYNGRFFNARVNDRIPITVLWDGQFLDTGVWAIHKGTSHRAAAETFIRFATRSESMAAFSELIPYGPMRRSAINRIGLHAQSNAPMLHHMPTSPSNLKRAIRADTQWYAHTEALRQRRFETWLAEAPDP